MPQTSGEQTRRLIAGLDALADRLRPPRRPIDRGAAECSPQELSALNALGRDGRLTMTDLAGALRVPLSTATRLVDRLSQKGLVERRQLTADRRVVHVAFSRRGKRINQFVVDARTAAAQSILHVLPPRDRSTLLRLLDAIAASQPTAAVRTKA